jgi:lipoyl(octanoyl) transferase
VSISAPAHRSTSRHRAIQVLRPGCLPYDTAWAWQQDLARRRSAGTLADTLVLLEHPHTYTLGRASHRQHLLVDQATLVAQGATLREVDRGGDITYHGPGQIVGYPILKLSRYGGDMIRYLRMLEETLICAVADYGVVATRIPGLTGVWAGDAKLAAIGVKLTASGVTMHGFALNVDPDLRFFEQIVPCGIRGRGVTALARLLGEAPRKAAVEQSIVAAFGTVFDVDIVVASGE